MVIKVTNEMFTKKSHQDVKKSSVKIQDSKKDSATRLKHLKIVLEHFDVEEAKNYFETNFSHVYFILYDNFIQAENNLRQRVHKAGREELEGALSLLERVLCLLPELLAKRWQLHSLTRIFSKLLHIGNSQKLRAEAIRYFLLWYQALGDNAPVEVHRMFATLVPGMPEPQLLPSGSPISPKPFDLVPPGSNDIDIKQIMQHPNFSTINDTSKKETSDNNHSPGLMGKLVNVSASIFHDLNILNPVQCVEIHPLLPPGGNEKLVENETKYFLEMLLDGMATSVVRVQWKDRSHSKAMRNFAFLLEKFKIYYLPCICPQFDYNNSLYSPNLEVPVQHTILEDEFVQCRVSLIKWVASYAHAARRGGSEQSATQPSSLGSQPSGPPAHHDESETSFTHAPHAGGDSANSTPHPSLDSISNTEEISSTAVVRDVLNWSREHVDFTLEVLRQAFLLPFSQSTAIRRVITLYKDWIQMNVSELPPFLLESTSYGGDYQLSAVPAGVPPVHHQLGVPDAPVPAPRRLRNDSYLGAIHKDNPLVRIGLQNVLQVFMTQAANVFVASPSPVAPPGGLGQQQLLDEQTDTCKRVLNIYRYMVMHTPMDANTWEQLLLVLLQITSLVLTKVPPKRKHESLGGSLAPAIFQTLIVTWIKANLNVAVRPELWQSFMDVLGKLTHWEDLIKEWAKTMETLTRVLARHVYGLDLSELPLDRTAEGARRGVRRAPARATVTAGPVAVPVQPTGKSSKTAQEFRKGLSSSESSRRSLSRCRSDPHLSSTSPTLSALQNYTSEDGKSPKLTKPRRCHSLDSLRNTHLQEDRDSESGTRSPSPAPSSGVESSSIKDSPLQIDLASDGGNVEWSSEDSTATSRGSARGVVCGGTARGWLPDVAAVLWRRMLAALGDPNNLRDPALHAHLFHYLLHLNDTLVKISANQSLNGNTETHVPFNLVAGWCLQAEALPQTHRQGKLLALRLLCCSTNATNPGGPQQCGNRLHLAHLHLYHRALHHGLTGEDRNVVDVLIKYAAPRYLSLALDGHSLLLLDFVHASTVVLNSTDIGPNCPRTEAVTFLGSLLSLPDSLMSAPMLQPYPHQYTTVSCPDLKEHVLNIVIRVCRREPAARARCGGALALAAHCHRLLATRTYSERLPQCVLNLLQMLTMKNRNIAKVVSDVILLLSDYTDRIMEQYPDLAGKIVWWICSCLAQLGRAGARDAVLAGVLLQALAEYCCRMGLEALMQPAPGSKDTLLLIVFKVLYAVMSGTNGSDIEGLSLKVDEDFDPNIQLDNMGPKTLSAATIDIKLWAQMVCSQLVLWLGHWPLWGSWQLSSEVSEQHDGRGAELGAAVLRADNLQLLRLADSTLASLLELPALPSPAGCIAPGLVTCDKQVRIILRDLAGKACWDASALHYDPQAARQQHDPPRPVPMRHDEPSPRDVILSSLPPPYTPDKLPDYQLSPPSHHQLDHLLQYIGHTSPEVLQHSGQRLDAAGPSPLPPGAEDEVIALLVSQRNAERDYRARATQHDIATETPTPADTAQLDNGNSPPLPFQQCRLFLSQFGALAWGRRKSVQLMKRSERLIRELKNLDSQRCRETHKVAVIYVARGQENRNEILANRCGSPAYESFLAALAWEVELESHVGFSGGLQRGGPGGVTAPYVATLTLEALFHVATRMPSNTPEAILNKTRHLGNDEVHVVWSEHWRAYRRDTLPTQFCDVLIVLYPLPGGLLRCTLTRKQDVPMFGPLAEESVVSVRAAAGLVRAAALAGGRAVRATMPLYRHAHAERAAALAALCGPHAQPTTFETFVRLLREPVDAQHSEASGGTLAAALLDHGATQQLGNWGTEPHSVSPRPLKRLGHFKRPQATTPPATPHASAPRKNR